MVGVAVPLPRNVQAASIYRSMSLSSASLPLLLKTRFRHCVFS